MQLTFDFEALARKNGIDDVMTTKEAARLTGLAERTVRQYRLDGKIPAIQYSAKSFRFLRRDVVGFMSGNYRKHTLN